MRQTLAFLFLSHLLAGCAGAGGGASTVAPADSAHLHAVAGEHQGDAPVASPATRAAHAEVAAERVTYGTADGGALQGYLARPAEGDGHSAVILIHEWWGLNENMEAMTRRLAAEGYTALAVDLFGGTVARQPEEARDLVAAVSGDPEAATRNLQQAVSYLRGRGAERVGTIGWCFGGGWSLRAALAMPERVDAAVIYYGQLVTDTEALRPLQAPVLGLFGAEDRAPAVAQVREFEAALRSLGKDVSVHVYEGAGHAFANPSGRNYQPAAAEDAWQRTTEFLVRHLSR